MTTKLTQGDEFGQLSANMIRYYQIWAKQQGIHYNQLAVLHSLIRHQQCTQKQICDDWLLPKQTISAICQQYFAEGILTYVATADKREKLLSLTPQGTAFAQPIIQRLDALEQRIFAQFGTARSTQLLHDLQELSHIFAACLTESPADSNTQNNT